MRDGRERSFEVGGSWTVEDLAAALAPVGAVAPAPARGVVCATYYDTDRLDLAEAGITLRRGRGAGDAGWQVQLPGDAPDEGAEYWVPLRAGDGVPEDVQALLTRFVGSAALRPVARARTTRTTFEVIGTAGEVLARLADDRVVALRADDGAPSAWREVAVLPLRQSTGCRDEIARALTDAGASPSPNGTRLRRVLAAPARRGRRRRDPLVARLATQLSELLRCEAGARDGDGDAIHDMRVATRRLRSCLSTFSGAFAPEALEDVRDDLRELGRRLGAARDADVLAARLEADLAGVPAAQVLGPVRAVIRAHGAREAAAADRALAALLDGAEYEALLERLARLVDDPPLVKGDRSRAWYRARLRRVERRVERLVARARQTTGAERVAVLHAVRKAAKQARYAAETAVPVLGKEAARRAQAYAGIQEELGEHHDAVVARTFLREEGARAGVRPGENGFTYGLLYGREDARAEAAEARFRKRWRKLARRGR